MIRAGRDITPRFTPLWRRGVLRALAPVLVVNLLPAATHAQFQFSDRTPGPKNEVPAPIQGLELKNRLGERIPLDLPMTDASGKKIVVGDLFNRPARDAEGRALGHNKPVVLVMVYFRCPLQCPTVMNRFTQSIRSLDFTAGREFDAVVVSFDHRDTFTDAASQRNAQVLAYNRGSPDDARVGWNFLVGEPDNTRRLADAVGFPYRYLPESGEFSHGTAVFVLTPDARVSRVFSNIDYPASDLRLALLEAADGKIGGLFDRLVVWCYHFNPSSGKYSLQALRVMQIGGAASVVVLGGVVGGLVVRERRRRGRPGMVGGANGDVGLFRAAPTPAGEGGAG